jgi:hypothetical protein
MMRVLTTTRARSRVLYLASVVARSLMAVENDPNKPVFVTIRLSREQALQLDQLGSVLNTRNRGETARTAVLSQIKRSFPLSSSPQE